jgi:hypothetical protein
LALCAVAALVARRASADDKATCLDAASNGQKLQDAHKLLEARNQFRACAGAACPAAVQSDCAGWLDAVEKGIPTVVFTAKDASGGDLSAVKVTMDGTLLTASLDGSSLPVDPGEHRFTFETDGQGKVSRTILIVQGQKDRREQVAFGQPGAGAAPPGSPFAKPTADQGAGLGTQKVLALVAGGLGVVGVGVGTAFGVITMSKKSDAQNACAGSTCTTMDGSSKWSDAASAGNVSTIGFVAGGVALAGAAVLWFTAPSPNAAGRTQVGFGPGGVEVKGTW